MLLGLLAAGPSAAQTPREPGAPIRFRHLGVEDGLSNPYVHAIHQYHLGFLWFGTDDGLNRYDGTALRVYRPVPFDTTSLPGIWIVGLTGGIAEPGFWIVTERGTLGRYNPVADRFKTLPGVPGSPVMEAVQVMHRSRAGVLWFGGEGGAVRFDSSVSSPQARAPSAAARFRVRADDPEGLTGNPLTVLLEDRRGRLWAGTRSGGLRRFDPTTGQLVAYRHVTGDATALPADNVTSLLEDQTGRLWVGTTRGLVRYDAAADAFAPVPGLTEQVGPLLEDPAGHLWAGTDRGLARLIPGSGRVTRHRHDPADAASLRSGPVRSLFLDRSGVVWVGTDHGLSMFEWAPPPFGLLTHDPSDPNSLDSPDVWASLVDRQGTLWVGTMGGLNRVDRATGRVTRYRHVPGDSSSLSPGSVFALHETRDSTLWVGTARDQTHPGVLHRLDRATGRVAERFVVDPEDWPRATGTPGGLPTDSPWSLFEDSRGRLWVLSEDGGCPSVMDRKQGTFIPHCLTTGPPRAAQQMTEGPGGVLWFATWGDGLARLDIDTGALSYLRHDPADPNSLAGDDINGVHRTADGALWIGYYGAGLSRFDPATGAFEHYHTANSALPSDALYAIEEDEEGALWLSTPRGLVRFTPATERFEVFGLDDGLQSLEFNGASSYRAPSGELFFGGVGGLNYFFPARLIRNPVPPPVVVTAVAVDGVRVASGEDAPLAAAAPHAERVHLAPAQRDVAFHFAALHYANPARNRYRYKLDGYDTDWHAPDGEPVATYTNLDPGRYTFRVQAANADGVWNEEGAALAVVVAPFLYETWWFLALCVLGAAGLLVAGYRARVRRLSRDRHALERQVGERTEALRTEKRKTEAQAERLLEMDRLKTRFFTNVSHEFRTPLTLAIGPLEDLRAEEASPLPEPAREKVTLALRNSRRLLRLTNQLLDVAKLEAGEVRLKAHEQDLAAFLSHLARSFVPLAERRRVRFEVDLPGEPLPVYFDAEKLEHVVVNLLSNAFKFTPEGGAVRLEVEEREHEERLVALVRVRDNGRGVPADKLPHLFERFYQVDETNAEGRAGSGIGLSLAKDLAELHGGTVSVESTVGFGSVFTAVLPLGRAHLRDEQIAAPEDTPPELLRLSVGAGDGQANEAALREEGDESAAAEDDRTTVLVVDDNAEIRAYVRSHLGAQYRILEAPDGAEALETAREALPDLVVSDVMMPELDGFALVRALKADRQTDFIPVILLTAKATTSDRLDGLDEGADDYLTKPFDVRELKARVRNLIASRQSLKERLLHAAPQPNSEAPGIAGEEPSSVSAADRAFLDDVRAAVETRLADEDFTVEDLAEAVAQSRSNLHRRMRLLLDASPSAFIRRRRLERAAELLRAQEGSVSEIAYAVGFKSVSHFSQSFRKAYDTTPSEYAG